MNYPARRFIFDGKTMPTVIPKIFGRNTGQTYMLITPHQPGSGSTNYTNGGRDGCFSPRRTYPRRRRPSPGVKFRCGRKMRKTTRNIVSCRGAADAHLPRTWTWWKCGRGLWDMHRGNRTSAAGVMLAVRPAATRGQLVDLCRPRRHISPSWPSLGVSHSLFPTMLSGVRRMRNLSSPKVCWFFSTSGKIRCAKRDSVKLGGVVKFRRGRCAFSGSRVHFILIQQARIKNTPKKERLKI